MTGNGFRLLRQQVGLRQKEVAEEIGVSKYTVCRWEKREWEPVPRMAEMALKALVLDVDKVAGLKAGRPRGLSREERARRHAEKVRRKLGGR